MKTTLILLIGFLLVACGTTPGEWPATSQSATPSATTNARLEGKFEVKAVRNGVTIAEYRQTGARPVGLIDGDNLTIMLYSPDDKHILTIESQTVTAGAYPFVDQNGGPQQGQARMDLMTPAAPVVLIANGGELRLDEVSEKSCSGSFKGTGTDVKGGTFSVVGSFSKMLLRRV
jgi:hypothetical protein